jgi:hypothetical protein
VNASAKSKSTVLPYEVARLRVCFNSSEADGVWATFSGLQLETGEATEYKPYIDPTTVTITRYGTDETDNLQTYTPKSDGACEIPSLSPTMTLLTDTEGVSIELEYNQDTNKAMDNVKSDLQELDRVTSELALAEGIAESYLYTSFTAAVADLNASTTENADATEENAVCAIYNDSDENTHLMILSDIEITETITFSVPVIFELNGHTVSINGDYRIVIAGDNSIVDGSIGVSQVIKKTETNTVSNCLRFTGNNCKLLCGFFSIEAPADSKIVVCVAAVGDYLLVDGAEIQTSATGGTKNAYCVSTNKKVIVLNSTITCNSLEGVCVGVASVNENEELLVKNSKFHITSSCGDTQLYIYAIDSYNVIAENCDVFVEGEYVRSVGFNITTTGTIRDCSAYIGSVHGGGCCLKNDGIATVENSSFFADGTTGSVSVGNENYAGTQGVWNLGTISLLNCNVYGTHTGLQCAELSITKVNGGLYEGPGHGGIYVACDGGQFYAENATIRNATYRGKYKSQYWYGNGMYVVAAVYVGCGHGIKAYFDNCVIDGERNEPIAFRVSEQEGENSAYVSNCTIMGDGKIRFGGNTMILYTGFCNRILCEANFPDQIISDGEKVYIGYEESVTV